MENADMANGDIKILFFMPFNLHVALIFYFFKKFIHIEFIWANQMY